MGGQLIISGFYCTGMSGFGVFIGIYTALSEPPDLGRAQKHGKIGSQDVLLYSCT